MKDIITSREELLWAKLAGRNVYLSTMTPPVASSMKEKLMLETAERIGTGGGGGSDNDYPVTATLTAGMAIEQVSKDTAAIKAAFDAGKKVHLVIDGSVMGAFIDLPLTEIASDDSAWFGGIISLGDTAQGYMIVQLKENDDPAFSLFGVPTPSAADNGKILGVDDGEYALVDAKNPLIVAGTLGGTVGAMTVTITDSLADIYAAAEAGRYVALEFSLGGGMFRLPLYGRAIENETIVLSFSKTILVGSTPALYTVEFEGAQTASVNPVVLAVGEQ